MSVWAIADLHLSFARPDRRERYAGRWRDHAGDDRARVAPVVRPDDLVLLPGDLSMARNHRDLQPDLAWLDRLPGTKVLAPGNHDVWWNDAEKVRPMLRPSQRAVGGDAVATHGVIVCGTLGAPVLPDEPTPEQPRRLGARAGRTRPGARGGRAAPVDQEPLYVLWHYPPFDQHRRPGPCVGGSRRRA